ncbi:MAG TPA: AMP-binding protein, partial [Enteractinococcus sp.]
MVHSTQEPSTEPIWWQDIEEEVFTWHHPATFNIGLAILEDKAPDDTAIIETGERELVVTFGQLRDEACRLATWLQDQGIHEGDRIAVFLAQQYELAVVHAAGYLIGAVVVPLTTRFGPDAVQYRLSDSESKVIFGASHDLQRISSALEQVPSLTHIVSVDGEPVSDHSAQQVSYQSCLAAQPMSLDDVTVTDPDAPAVLIYTSGTTGNPKGALHAHRVLIGHMPGIRYTHASFPQPGDMMWTPAEWAWIGGLFDVLIPSLACNVPVVASKSRFSPELAKHIFETIGARNAFLPPTAIKQLRASHVSIRPGAIRTIAAGGEPLGAELQVWSREHLGVEINEFYGQTEMNLVIGQNRTREEPPEGSMGRQLPGFEIKILNDVGEEVAPGETGEICVHTPNPGEFLGYWNQPEQTASKYHGQYLRTGDLGRQDEHGYFYFGSR